VKIGQFEFKDWQKYHDTYGDFHSRLLKFDDSVFGVLNKFEFARSEICLFEPSTCRFSDNWGVEFYGLFGKKFEKWEDKIDFSPTDTVEEAKQKVDDLLIRLSKLESFE
jgi:hypothetical protein